MSSNASRGSSFVTRGIQRFRILLDDTVHDLSPRCSQQLPRLQGESGGGRCYRGRRHGLPEDGAAGQVEIIDLGDSLPRDEPENGDAPLETQELVRNPMPLYSATAPEYDQMLDAEVARSMSQDLMRLLWFGRPW